MSEKRREQRRHTNAMFALTWQDAKGKSRTLRARGLNVSKSGMRVETSEEFKPGDEISLRGERHDLSGKATVRNCARRGSYFVIGVEFAEETKNTITLPLADAVDYYEVLQVSPNADPETVHRVYRIMAARFHPDNPQTGDTERFVLLNEAYDLLSNPERRASYDASRRMGEAAPMPIFELKAFVDGIEGEANRRLGILCLLYNQRRRDMEHPGLSLLDLERLMSFPREFLAFGIWYLKDKGFILMGDNSDYTLTGAGADFVEANSPRHEVLHKLLNA
ncbi:MAG: DnaJ domain-containing protein [Bryobacteraceae bacterium]